MARVKMPTFPANASNIRKVTNKKSTQSFIDVTTEDTHEVTRVLNAKFSARF
jgi:RNA polymerase-interacting CarD/CdnL/TRCF family regulator